MSFLKGWEEANPICPNRWIEGKFHHSCYLTKGHEGECACGYCDEICEGLEHEEVTI